MPIFLKIISIFFIRSDSLCLNSFIPVNFDIPFVKAAIIKSIQNSSISDGTNFFGHFGALISSALLFLFGVYSYVIGFFVSFAGITLLFGLMVKNNFLKFFLIIFSSICFNHLFAETIFYYSGTGIIYKTVADILGGVLSNYSLPFIETFLFHLLVNLLCLFFLIIILFYVFGIKFR